MSSSEENEVFEIGSMEHLYSLLSLAEYRAEKQGIPFKRDDYKWVLGVKTYFKLKVNDHINIVYNEPRMLFGILVELDHQNPYNIQLWENITDKL